VFVQYQCSVAPDKLFIAPVSKFTTPENPIENLLKELNSDRTCFAIIE
jgi:hypothetical protein